MKKSHALALACAMLSIALISPHASAHAVIQSSVPAAGSTVDGPPKDIMIVFNEKVEEAFSSISLKDETGKAIVTAKAKLDAANPAVLKLALPELGAGKYLVKWVGIGNDGHRRTGQFNFTVK